jgi:hypothetical protein
MSKYGVMKPYGRIRMIEPQGRIRIGFTFLAIRVDNNA